MNNICLVDMDGTLVDYNQAMYDSLMEVMPPSLHPMVEEHRHNMWPLDDIPWLKTLMRTIKSVPGWWLNMPSYKMGWDVYRAAEELKFDMKILTKGPWNNTQAWKEKVDYIYKHFPENTPEIDIVSKDKHGISGSILVEDYLPYLEPWLEHNPKGLGVLIDSPTSTGWTHSRCIRYDGHNLEEVEHQMRLLKLKESTLNFQERNA